MLTGQTVRYEPGNYTEAEVVGQRITLLIPPELRDREDKIFERLKAGGRIEHYETKQRLENAEAGRCLTGYWSS